LSRGPGKKGSLAKARGSKEKLRRKEVYSEERRRGRLWEKIIVIFRGLLLWIGDIARSKEKERLALGR